uniref:Uncharacterized protein n=1 Tax=Setaria digitata TaxID=48799 RepID=A0A915PUU6_9BILA
MPGYYGSVVSVVLDKIVLFRFGLFSQRSGIGRCAVTIGALFLNLNHFTVQFDSRVLTMSTPIDVQSEDADRENGATRERDASSPPAKVTRSEWKASVIRRPRKHLDTVCSQGSEGADEDLSVGDATKFSGIDSDRSDSPAAEPDRITPDPNFEHGDSDSEQTTQFTSDCGDLLKDVENITESSDSSDHSPERTEQDDLHEQREHSPERPVSPLVAGELPESSKGPSTPYFSEADRVNSLRKRMAIYSPSDSIMSPCTLKLNRPKNFFRMRQKAIARSLMSAEEFNEENDDDADGDDYDDGNDYDDEDTTAVDEVDCAATGEADIPSDVGRDTAGGDITTPNLEGSDHDDN